jgi:Tol biopolymer transport system component/predicted Ser/Thr protein kinase
MRMRGTVFTPIFTAKWDRINYNSMPLPSGTRLGPYEIAGPIGAGGMGEVYRAHDSRLNRDVAIKVSAQQFSERFEREAKVIASLNHPNICHLYDVGPNYLVMELVEGTTLAARIKEGAIPLEESLAIAKQMADAIEAAHEKGITHRDLKPGNVMLKPNGAVKVLDFGLAKLGNTPTAQSDNSPTVTIGMTEAGVILGTASYMSPEQAKGKDVDTRSDIYAFGLVLYEMLTGKRLHRGETTTEILASVLREEPDWTNVPPQVQRLLRRCLEKDPQKRQRNIGDAMALVDDAPASGTISGAMPAAPPAAAKNRWLWPSVAVAAIAVVAIAAAVWAPWRGTSNVQAIRFQIPSTDTAKFIPGGFPAVSPDGRWVVFPGTGADGVTRMWIRGLDTVEVRPLTGTESPNNLPAPVFWSPDSRFIAFSTGSGGSSPGQLKKLNISGGPPQTVCDIASAIPGGTWSRDGVIVFGSNNGALTRVAAAGGIAAPITLLDVSRKESQHRWPQFLPDGRHFIYFRNSATPEFRGMYVGSLDVKPEQQSLKPLLLTDRQAVYSVGVNGGPGRLLFLRDSTLFAQPFDPGRLELTGEAVPVADQVGSFVPANAGLFSVSETGVLAYRVGTGGALDQLTWFDAQGKSTGTLGEMGSYADPAISPDGARVAVTQYDSGLGNSNIWVMDIARGTSTRLTFNQGSDDNPVWSPDGKTIAYRSNHGGHGDLYQKPADGSGQERLLLKSDQDKTPTSWSRDGRFLLYTNIDLKTRDDLWVLPLEGEPKPIPFLRTEFREAQGRFSPDGRWIAYTSEESGNPEIYVRPFSPTASGDSASGGKWLVSNGGGAEPNWRGDGKQLFYIPPFQLQQMAVDVATDKTFQAGVPKRLFAAPQYLTSAAVSTDGKRFLFPAIGGTGASTQTPFTVVTNWQAALKK